MIFVLAVNSDGPTLGKFVSRFTIEMQQRYDTKGLRISPRPDWAPSDFITTCKNFPYSTRGAFIIQLGEISSTLSSIYIEKTTYTLTHGTLVYANCDGGTPSISAPHLSKVALPLSAPPSPGPDETVVSGKAITFSQNTADTTNWITSQSTATPPPVARITWWSDELDASGKLPRWQILTPLSIGLNLVGELLSILPSYSTTKATSITYPTPQPGSSYPPSGSATSATTTNVQSNSNVSTLGSIGGALLQNSLTYNNNIEGGPLGDAGVIDSVTHLVDKLIDQLQCAVPQTLRGLPLCANWNVKSTYSRAITKAPPVVTVPP